MNGWGRIVAVGVSLGLAASARAVDPYRPACQQMRLTPALTAALTPAPHGLLGLPDLPQPVPGPGPPTVARGDGRLVAELVGSYLDFGTVPPTPRIAALAPPGTEALPTPIPRLPAGTGPEVGTVVVTPTTFDGPAAVVLPRPPTGIGPAPEGHEAALLARVRAGDRAPEVESALQRLSRATLLARLAECSLWDAQDKPVADRLVGVLLARGELDPAKSDGWGRDLMLKVADALGRGTDERCQALYQRLLDADEQTRLDDWVPELYGLAVYLRRRGAYAQAAKLWLAGERYTTSALVLDDFRLEGAWDLRRAGDAAGADRIEDALLNSKSGADWVIGLVTFTRAQRLLLAGQHAELRALLARPLNLSGPGEAPVKVALDGLLADSLWATGDHAGARVAYARVVSGYAQLGDRRPGSGLENVVAAARRKLAEKLD